MLAIEVEFLTGVSVAAQPNRREEPEWPPQPDRLFQALVAAWGRNAEPDDQERVALEWLEGLPTDGIRVIAPPAHRRDVVTVYVPPNDARTVGKPGDKTPRNPAAAARVIPELRKNRQPRAFPAVLPMADPALVRYVWPDAPEVERHRDPLARLAREVTYLGHSQSLVRVALIDAEEARISEDSAWSGECAAPLRLPFRGRLADLVARYEFSRATGKVVRPAPSLVTHHFEPATAPTSTSSCFDPDNVTVFADAGGFVPTLEAWPLVAKRLRDALLRTATDRALPIPSLLSGHEPDGRPARKPHVSFAPLADVGWAHSQGRLMGLALIWPREAADEDRRAALRVLAAFLGQQRDEVGLLHFGRRGSWRVALELESERASLRFGRYAREARRWGTVLPVALDRYPKDKPGEELASIIAQACLNIGLPPEAVNGLEVEVHKHGSIKGSPSAAEVRDALAQDSLYRGRPLLHLVLTFLRPVRGPLILGAGRFRGLGLCLPLDEERP